LNELNLYHPLFTPASYIIAFDTIVRICLRDIFLLKKTMGVSNNPKTAVSEFLKTNKNFEIDSSIDNKLPLSASLRGYLKRVK